MTNNEIDEIRERYQETSEGTWENDGGCIYADCLSLIGASSYGNGYFINNNDAEFTACAHQDILALLATVEKLQKEVEEWKDTCCILQDEE